MTETEGPYKQVRMEEVLTDERAKRNLSTLDKQWLEVTRHRTANTLAIGLLVLFGITIVASGASITALAIASMFSTRPTSDFTAGIEQMVKFTSALLPFIATPLGVALGYYFRETQGD